LSSIYWKYLESQKLANLENNNFNYTTMIDYVNGLGDYWIRLVEQMVPATTLWNTGVRYENSIFHRQKFVWRRQEGCQLIPIPCRPCSLTTIIFDYDCPVQQSECPIYPTDNFSTILGSVLNNYLREHKYNLSNCVQSTLKSEWFVDLSVDGESLVKEYFFTGIGYSNTGLGSPSNSQWYSALVIALDKFVIYGYGYSLTPVGNPTTVTIYNSSCSDNKSGVNFKINVGINFNILCN
jgi:hypothetical protein